MEELLEKVQELNSLLKAMKTSIQPAKASLSKPSIPKPKLPSAAHEVPNAAPQSKKDPLKVAEQIKSGKVRETNIKDAKKNRGKLNMNKLGQWSLNPAGKV